MSDFFDDILELIVNKKGIEFLQAWVAARVQTQATEPQQQPKPNNRGRKAGAAPDDQRCIWAHTKAGQCKNSKHEASEYCKIHVGKAALIGDDAASFVSGQ